MLSADYIRIEEQFNNLPDETRLIILHPAAYNQHRIFGRFFLSFPHVVYVDLSGALPDSHEILLTIASAVEQQLGVSLGRSSTKSATIIKKLVKALNAQDDALLYLDGYDGDVATALHTFLVQMVTGLDAACRIVISGRQVPNPALVDNRISRQKMALLPIDEQRMLTDYIHPEVDKVSLEVRAFGQGQVRVDGIPIEKWDGVLPRVLFFFLVDRAMATRDDIFKIFWPHLPVREATNVFHVTKRKISEILGTNLTIYGGGFYRVAPTIDLHYDVVKFQEAVQNAAVSNEETAEELYQIAVDLYREDFLSDVDREWVKRRRDEMQKTYTEALVGLARIREKHDDWKLALGFYLRAWRVAPTREDVARSIMKIYDVLGQPERALEIYHQLGFALKNELDVTPDPQTRELMEQIQKKL